MAIHSDPARLEDSFHFGLTVGQGAPRLSQQSPKKKNSMAVAKTDEGRKRQASAGRANWLKFNLRGGRIAFDGLISSEDIQRHFTEEELYLLETIWNAHQRFIESLDARRVGPKRPCGFKCKS